LALLLLLNLKKGFFMTTALSPATSGIDSQNTLQLLHDAKARNVAQEFESIFTSMMIKSMRGNQETGDNDFMPNSLGQKLYTEMLDDEYGKLMSQHSTLGLANLVLKQIQKDEKSSIPSLEMLSGLKVQRWMFDKQLTDALQNAPSVKAAENALAQWKPIISKAGREYGVDPTLISAVIMQESGGNPNAVSPKGAKGLMQLMDSTANQLGVKQVFNPQQNIFAGTKYLSQMLARYDGNESLALASYNAGPAAVDQYKGVPPYQETRAYIANIAHLKDALAQKTAQ
jgi:Rod binding domain-containing protein